MQNRQTCSSSRMLTATLSLYLTISAESVHSMPPAAKHQDHGNVSIKATASEMLCGPSGTVTFCLHSSWNLPHAV